MKVSIKDVKKYLFLLNQIIAGQNSSSLKEEPIKISCQLPKETLVANPKKGKLFIENSSNNLFYKIKVYIECDIDEEGSVYVLPENLKILNKSLLDDIAVFSIKTTDSRIIYNMGSLGSINKPIYGGDVRIVRSGLTQQGRKWELILNDSVIKLQEEEDKEIMTPLCEGLRNIYFLDKRNPICIKTKESSGLVSLIAKGDMSSIVVSIDFNTEVHKENSKCWITPYIRDFIKPQFVDSVFKLYKDEETDNLFKIVVSCGEIIYVKDNTTVSQQYDQIDRFLLNKGNKFIRLGYFSFRIEDFINVVKIHSSPEDNTTELTMDLNIEENCLEMKGENTREAGKIPLNTLQIDKENWNPITLFAPETDKVARVYSSLKNSNMQIDVYKIENMKEPKDPCYLIFKLVTGVIDGSPTTYLPSNVKTE